MPIMSSVVMTGRRMNSPVRLTLLSPPVASTSTAARSRRAAAGTTIATAAIAAIAAASTAPATPTTARTTGTPAIVRAANAHGRIGCQARLSVDDHTIADPEAVGDDGQTTSRAFDRYGTLPRCISAIDDIDVRAPLSRDDRLLRHDERAVLIEKVQRGRRELPRPQPAVHVIERRFELDGSRGCVDCIVDERELSEHAIAGGSALLD